MERMMEGKVVVVTGAGGGIGREIALQLAAEGAKVVVNDIGVALNGDNLSADEAPVAPADGVVAEIRAAGGTAVANFDSVAEHASANAIIQCAMDEFGRIDGVVNNAGNLRDRSFHKMSEDEWRSVIAVHLDGTFFVSRSAAAHFREQEGGAMVHMTSTSGLIGNYGQANYGAAKLAQVGLMQTLAIEGAKHGIHVNALAPTAATRMTEGLMPEAVLAALKPEAVVPAMLVLAHESAPTRTTLCAGAGGFEAAFITLTEGVYLGQGDQVPEQLAGQLAQVLDRSGEQVPASGAAQGTLEVGKAMAAAR